MDLKVKQVLCMQDKTFDEIFNPKERSRSILLDFWEEENFFHFIWICLHFISADFLDFQQLNGPFNKKEPFVEIWCFVDGFCIFWEKKRRFSQILEAWEM